MRYAHSSPPPRIIVYGIGKYGQYIVRFAVQKGWPIIAAYNRAGEKIGQDAGLLSGLDAPLGVRVQDCDTASYNRSEEHTSGHQSLMRISYSVFCLKKKK